MADDRLYDIALFGATGFTGSLAAEYLAVHAPPETRWAIAGRDAGKLQALAQRLGVEVGILHADVQDPASMRALADSARVLATTVGPYLQYGEPLVQACARAGTDYVDLTGEPEFVDLMYIRHHAAALQSGAKIVHSCGFDSIPHDLGVQLTVQQLPDDAPLKVQGFVSARGSISGGTLHSAVGVFARLRPGAAVAAQRRSLETPPAGRRVHGVKGMPRNEPGIGWVLPLPTIDPQVVLRSAAALPEYGPDFSYGHYLVAGKLPVAGAIAGGAATAIALAQVPVTRKLLLDRIASGEGPDATRRAQSSFKLRFTGEGGAQRVSCEVSGGDPGYEETAKMLSESALCLAHDQLPDQAGQLTTAVAMGVKLRERLQRQGIAFTVTEPATP